MPQSGKTQCCECHGGGAGGAGFKTYEKCENSGCADEKTLQTDLQQGILWQYGGISRPGLIVKQRRVRRFHADGKGRQAVCNQIDEQKLHCGKRCGQRHDCSVEHSQYSGGVAGKEKRNCVLNVGVNVSAV